jgi:hypothetical protein
LVRLLSGVEVPRWWSSRAFAYYIGGLVEQSVAHRAVTVCQLPAGLADGLGDRGRVVALVGGCGGQRGVDVVDEVVFGEGFLDEVHVGVEDALGGQ